MFYKCMCFLILGNVFSRKEIIVLNPKLIKLQTHTLDFFNA